MNEKDSQELRDEYIRQNGVDNFIDFTQQDFNSITDFFEESIFLHNSKLWHDAWIEIFDKY
jgi:hypothetical protein